LMTQNSQLRTHILNSHPEVKKGTHENVCIFGGDAFDWPDAVGAIEQNLSGHSCQ
jgi:hypothetical protein